MLSAGRIWSATGGGEGVNIVWREGKGMCYACLEKNEGRKN